MQNVTARTPPEPVAQATAGKVSTQKEHVPHGKEKKKKKKTAEAKV